MMKDYIVTVETVFRRELGISAENENMAMATVLAIAGKAEDSYDEEDDFHANRFYLREVGEPESANREICAICKLTDEEMEEAGDDEDMVCNPDCESSDYEENCKIILDFLDVLENPDNYDDTADHEIEDSDEPEDHVSYADILDYFDFISGQLENLTSLLEKVCKAIPKE